MTDRDTLVFECELDAPPEKVWRALSVPQYLRAWLKPSAHVDLHVIAAQENRSLQLRWREAGQGAALEVEDSVVTFELAPTTEGRTWFRLTHAPEVMPVAANGNGLMMQAA